MSAELDAAVDAIAARTGLRPQVGVTLGSGLGNPDVHDHTNLPIVVAGGASQMKGGRHIKYAEPTPLANLHATLMDKVGVPTERFADSNGKVNELLEPLSL